MLTLIPLTVIVLILGLTTVSTRLSASPFDQDGQPDEECLFDPSLPKCTPGPEGCPVGFSMNAYEQCFPRHPSGCPQGYHSHEDDESGRCIPDSEECAEGYIMNPDYPECRLIEYVCEKHPSINECITEITNLQNTSSRTAK